MGRSWGMVALGRCFSAAMPHHIPTIYHISRITYHITCCWAGKAGSAVEPVDALRGRG